MDIYFNNNKVTNNSIILKKNTINKPNIKLNLNDVKDSYYFLIMYDPNSVSSSKTYIHWLIVNINNNNILNGIELLPYKSPTPPENTGYHNYTLILLKQKEKIEDTQNILNLNRDMTIDSVLEIINKSTELNEITKTIFKTQFGGKNNKNNKNKITKRKRKRENKKRTKRKR
jgi:phosphatidylethanolamine-binding protein (PEBP) family uncharacterized protein